ncbi:MAG: YihY/virulence factor BrkB family protein [Chloroflexota bacterium]|nr:YihY/virulence factor BrkB family protein [Chloroflexota bacterium]
MSSASSERSRVDRGSPPRHWRASRIAGVDQPGTQVDRVGVGTVGRQWAHQVVRDDVFGMAAELAYWFFLSLFPFFIFLAALGGFVAVAFDVGDPTQRLVDLLGDRMPPEATRLIRPQIEDVVANQDPGTLSLGLLAAIWVATSGANATIKATNRAYDVRETRPAWKRYLLALVTTLVTGTVLVVAFAVFVAGEVFGQAIAAAVGLGGAFRLAAEAARWLGVVVLLLAGSGLLYWVAPNVRLRLRWVVPGALLFTVGWLVATYLFALYVARFGSYSATYGTLAGVAVLLVWFYLTAFVLLAGAELNAVINEQLGPRELDEERRKEDKRLGDHTT